MKCLKSEQFGVHGSSLASSGAGNSGRMFGLLRSAPRGVK